MSEIVYQPASELLAWAADKIGGIRFRPDARPVGLMRGNEIVAVVVYDCFSECDANMHIASDGSRRWLNRAFLYTGFAHPFLQWGLRRVTGLVPASNKDALRFDLHLGFEYEGTCRNALPDDDVIILGLLRENCKYIKGLQHD